MKRRALLKTFSLAPLVGAAPAAKGDAHSLRSSSDLFIYDARLPSACALARAAASSGRNIFPIECDETGFWRSREKLDLNTPTRLTGATNRCAFYVFEQLSRLRWSHRLTDAAILHDERDLSIWTLRLQPVR